jgi:ribonuclease D
MPNSSEKHARELMDAVKRAGNLPQSALPQRNFNERPDPQTDAVAGLLNVVAGARAADHDISRTYLAPRDQIFALAAWWLRRDGTPPPDIPLLEDWRRDLLGAELLDILQGRLVLALDATPDRPPIRVVHLQSGH